MTSDFDAVIVRLDRIGEDVRDVRTDVRSLHGRVDALHVRIDTLIDAISDLRSDFDRHRHDDD